jgi:hypothetical protein
LKILDVSVVAARHLGFYARSLGSELIWAVA